MGAESHGSPKEPEIAGLPGESDLFFCFKAKVSPIGGFYEYRLRDFPRAQRPQNPLWDMGSQGCGIISVKSCGAF